MKLTHFVNSIKTEKRDNIVNKHNKKDKKYYFFLDNLSNYIYITDRLIFERENDEYIIKIELGKNNLCNIYLKKENLSFDIKVIEGTYIIKNNYIKFEYVLETDNNKHCIILETEE